MSLLLLIGSEGSFVALEDLGSRNVGRVPEDVLLDSPLVRREEAEAKALASGEIDWEDRRVWPRDDSDITRASER